MRFSAFCCLLAFLLPSQNLRALEIQLPTENHFLLTNEPEKFYMYVNRTFENVVSKAWEGGGYGLVRTPVRLTDGQVHTLKFHEGIDIAPMHRDAKGNPLDQIKCVAAGKVAYVSDVAGKSNYGKYVVVEHRFDGSMFYSLYAHLSKIDVKAGDELAMGGQIGQMGFTGAGIDCPRSHCHLEMCLLMSENYEAWHKTYAGSKNPHGLFNGMNLIGMDVAALFLKHQANPELSIQDIAKSQPVYFKVAIPRKGKWDFAERNSWLLSPGAKENDSPAWEISFTAVGFPVAIQPYPKAVTTPIVTAVRDSTVRHRFLTRSLIDGQGATAELMSNGKKLLALMTDDFPKQAAAGSKEAPAGDDE
jgi:Peptidase family M23